MPKYITLPAVIFAVFFTYQAEAQTIAATSAQDYAAAIAQRKQMRSNSIFKEYPVRSVGPEVMSGRVTDIAVDEDLPRHYYVAYASGGVFETTNNGDTMTPIFDYQGTLSMGDIAISRADKNVLWVGTGENNSSRSTYAGDGIYKSTDAGKTWNFMGLRGSQHIGRILTHPSNPDIAWTASMGPLYSENDVRGVYKTTDGGKTWGRTLTPPDSTGVIDLVIDPKNPDRLWAATWQKFRTAWNFQEAGKGSAIYASTDGGETWQKSMKGFPDGDFIGRIGLTISRSNPDILYALLDNQYETKTKREVTGDQKDQLKQTDFAKMTKAEFLALDNDKLQNYLQRNGFPKKYTARSIKQDIKEDVYKPKALADYLGDANAALFDTSIKGAEVYRSDDGGQSWKKVNSYDLDNIIFTYGYYFGQIRVAPTNPDVVYFAGVPAVKSTDGGKTWSPIAENNSVHVDYHALWIDPHDAEHIMVGNDGGLYESHDGGQNFIHHNNAAVGQFYNIAVDMDKPYHIYGGLQDNGTFMGSSQWTPGRGQPWKRIFGGDGMHVNVDPRNSDIVYAGFQFGNTFRINEATQKTTRITPKNDVGEETYRFNWNSPVELSPHNPDIVYFGAQKVLRSFDRGDTWQAISPDLTNEKASQQTGDVPYSTVTTITESPKNFNVIWAGTDDGNVQVTRDGGASWQLVSKNLPQKRWISNIHASEYDAGTAYLSMNGYRYDEFSTYLYKTTDYGQHWKSIKGNLPESVANIVICDPKVPDILYAGLDAGTFVSFDDGAGWWLLNGIPNVPAYDMLVHPRDLDLVVGTHGRSVYVADVKPIEKVYEHLNQPVLALKTEDVRHSNNWGKQPVKYRKINEPSVNWMYWIGQKDAKGVSVKITVKDKDGNTVTTLHDKADYGFNVFNWNLKISDKPEYLKTGTYKVIYNVAGHTDETTFKVTDSRRFRGADQRVFSSPDKIEFDDH